MEAQKEDIREYIYSLGGVCTEVLSEREIAEQFAIKRNHARELLLELVGEGVVERRPRSGYRYVDYQDTGADTVMLLRFIVEQEAAAIAMHHADREDEVRLTLACEALKKAAQAKDLPAFAAADREFHAALVRASRDNMLIRIFDFLLSTLFRREKLMLGFSDLHTATQLAHEGILRAFLARDRQDLQERLKQHLGYHCLKKRLDELAAPMEECYNRLNEPVCDPAPVCWSKDGKRKDSVTTPVNCSTVINRKE